MICKISILFIMFMFRSGVVDGEGLVLNEPVINIVHFNTIRSVIILIVMVHSCLDMNWLRQGIRISNLNRLWPNHLIIDVINALSDGKVSPVVLLMNPCIFYTTVADTHASNFAIVDLVVHPDLPSTKILRLKSLTLRVIEVAANALFLQINVKFTVTNPIILYFTHNNYIQQNLLS